MPIKDHISIKKSKVLPIVLVTIAAILLIAFLVIKFAVPYAFDSYFSQTKSIFASAQPISLSSISQSQTVQLKGEDTGRTNFMIYGLTLDENRTDTMMLASYYWNEHKLVLLNIPRDIYTKYNGYSGKIVSLYAIGKSLAKKGDRSFPAQYVTDFVSKEYQIPIDYWVVANMEAFKQLVDSLGGITVDVQESFTDYQYPTDDYSGYIRPAPHFDAGVQTMDGTKALIYARSRHSKGAEGTDFARSKRQQVIIAAIIDKLKAQGIFDDISKMTNYLNIFSQNIFTNLTPEEAIRIAQTIKNLDLTHDYEMTNWSVNSGFLCYATSADGQDIVLYGVINDCKTMAGEGTISIYRQEAINYVQNLLSYAAAMQSNSTQQSAH